MAIFRFKTTEITNHSNETHYQFFKSSMEKLSQLASLNSFQQKLIQINKGFSLLEFLLFIQLFVFLLVTYVEMNKFFEKKHSQLHSFYIYQFKKLEIKYAKFVK